VLLVLGCFAHDSQRILAAVYRLALVGVKLLCDVDNLRLRTVGFELSITPFTDADGRGWRCPYHSQVSVRHNRSLTHSAKASTPVDFKWHHYPEFASASERSAITLIWGITCRRETLSIISEKRFSEDLMSTADTARMKQPGYPSDGVGATMAVGYKFGGSHRIDCVCPSCEERGGQHKPDCMCPGCGDWGGRHHADCKCPLCGLTGGTHQPNCRCPMCRQCG
jgi:hypothetical protein